MASKLPKRGQSDEKSKLQLIDHSDIHFINERLDEELTFDLDYIFKKKFRQKMALDREILQLRKACKPRIPTYIDGRPATEGSKYNKNCLKRKATTPRNNYTPLPTQRVQRHGANNAFADSNGRAGGLITVSSLTLRPKPAIGNSGVAKPVGEMSQDLNRGKGSEKSSSVSLSGGSDDEDVSSDESDDSTKNESPTEETQLNSQNGDSSENRHRFYPQSSSYDKSEMTSHQYQSQIKTNEPPQRNRNRPGESFYSRARDGAISSRTPRNNKSELKMNLAILKLETVPFQWYTTVVPPRDHRQGRRATTTKNKSSLEYSGLSSKVPNSFLQGRSQPPTKASPSHAQTDRGFTMLSKRPQTSIGLVSTQSPLYSGQTERGKNQGKTNNFFQYREKSVDNPLVGPSLSSKAVPSKRDPHLRAGKPDAQPTRSGLFGMSRPKTTGKSRRQLMEQVQEEMNEAEKLASDHCTAFRKRCEETVAQQLTLDLRVRDFLRSLDDMKKSMVKRDILDRLACGSSLGYYAL